MRSGLSTKNRSVVQIGDKFRELRFAIRRVKELARQSDTNDRQLAIFELAYLLANASNGFLSTAETGLINMLSGESDSHLGNAKAYDLDRYFSLSAQASNSENSSHNSKEGSKENQIRFTRDQYFASKRILKMASNANFLLHQEKFLQIWQHCINQLDQHEATSAKNPDPYQLAAILTIAVIDTLPVRSPDSFNRDHITDEIDTNAFLAHALALVALVAATSDSEEEQPEDAVIYNSCICSALSQHQSFASLLKNETANVHHALVVYYSQHVQYLP